MPEKRCPRCGVTKPHSEFPLNRAKRSGVHTYCKACHSAKCAERKLPLEKRRVKHRAYYETPTGRATYLRAAAKMRWKGEIFSSEWLAEKIRAGKCEVTGLPFDMGRPEGRGQNPLAPSIDRIDPKRGYEPDNVQVVIFAFNAFKSNMSQERAVSLLRLMAGRV